MFNKKKRLIDSLQAELEEANKKNIEYENEISEQAGIIASCTDRNNYLNSIVTNEQLEADTIIKLLEDKRKEYKNIEIKLEEENIKYSENLKQHKNDLLEIESKIIRNNDRYNIQSYGFYEPVFPELCSSEIKDKVKENRLEQKDMLRNENYYTCNTSWQVNQSTTRGTTLINRMAKNYITSFNLMCDAIIDRVSVTNIQKTKSKIQKTFENINRQSKTYDLEFSQHYLDLKLQELDLMYSVVIKKEEEREERRLNAEMIKEQKKVEKEIAHQREKLEKELQHYENNLYKGDEGVTEKIEEIKKQIEENDYRKNNSLAGYVYIIENKSFGDDVYKIGVTRRLEPLDRIAELSNASVPFRFKPNCIIFSENAFQLESNLHKEFSEYRVNKVNRRKEYFQIPLSEINDVITKKYGISADFDFSPENDEWQVSTKELIGIDDEDDED